MKLNEKEENVLEALKQLNGRAFSKRIAEAAGMSPQTASKYLLSLEGKGAVIKDDSQRPHIFWEIAKGGNV